MQHLILLGAVLKNYIMVSSALILMESLFICLHDASSRSSNNPLTKPINLGSLRECLVHTNGEAGFWQFSQFPSNCRTVCHKPRFLYFLTKVILAWHHSCGTVVISYIILRCLLLYIHGYGDSIGKQLSVSNEMVRLLQLSSY